MIQVLKYNIRTINRRIYSEQSFLKPLPEYCYIESVEGEGTGIINLSHGIIFYAKVIETDSGIYLNILEYIKTKENDIFLDAFEGKKTGIAITYTGNVDVDRRVYGAGFIGAFLAESQYHTNFSYDFSLYGNKPQLILEFPPIKEEDRYGEKYVIKQKSFIP